MKNVFGSVQAGNLVCFVKSDMSNEVYKFKNKVDATAVNREVNLWTASSNLTYPISIVKFDSFIEVNGGVLVE